MKKQTGIWLDSRNAWVINLLVEHDGGTITEHIPSEMEEHVAIDRTKMDAGPHGGSNQRTLEERQHHEEHRYFVHILQHVRPNTEEIVIFGPSEAKHGLKNLLDKQHDRPQIMGVEAADHMTEHQIVAWVHNFFGRPAPRKMPVTGS